MADHPGSDHELADQLRRAAPQRLPLAGFDHASVLAASRRAGVRRRAVTAGIASVVLLLGGVAAVTALRSVPGSAATASSDATASSGATASSADPGRLAVDPVPTMGPPGLSPQLRSSGPCGPADRTVYAALVRVFAARSAEQPWPVSRECPAGSTGVSVLLTEDGMVGRFEVFVGPAAVVAADGATGTATTAGGRTVTVVSVPAAGVPAGPYAGTLDAVAQRVAVALG